jgi:hypothetical protein
MSLCGTMPAPASSRRLIVLFAVVMAAGCTAYHGATNSGDGSSWVREELYFGSDIPTGGMVTDSLWEDFLNTEVVPRFPEGFTTIPAIGRYRYATGEIMKEPTKIMIIFYSPESSQDSVKVGEIIQSYKTRFSQESVLRARTKVQAKFE